jgi:hypothetical protein
MTIALQVIEGTLDELPEIAEEWTALEATAAGRAERASWSLEWAHMVLDRLAELDDYSRAGMMVAEQDRRYRRLLERLDEALPTIERLNLCKPASRLDVGASAGAVDG